MLQYLNLNFITLIDLIIMAAATGYVVEILTNQEGPFDVFLKIRRKFPLGGLTTCPYCATPYVAAVILIIYIWLLPELILLLGICGVSLLPRFLVDNFKK